jgi:hypothetical protein
MRGVILGPRLEDMSKRGLATTVYPDPMLLRQCVLYWDMIDWPRYTMTGELPAEAKHLQDEGILISTTFEQPLLRADEKPRAGDVVMWTVNPRTQQESDRRVGRLEHYVIPQALAFKKNNADGSGLWSLAQPNPDLVLPTSQTDRTIEVELYRAVPVPSAATPIEEVLDLKRRRNSEMLAYRAAIDEIYQKVISSGDIPHAKTMEIEKLQKSVIELHRVMRAEKMPRSLASVKIALNPVDLGGVIQKLSVGALAALTFDFNTMAAAAAISLADALFRLKITGVRTLSQIPPELSAYAYLATIETELGPARGAV